MSTIRGRVSDAGNTTVQDILNMLEISVDSLSFPEGFDVNSYLTEKRITGYGLELNSDGRVIGEGSFFANQNEGIKAGDPITSRDYKDWSERGATWFLNSYSRL